MGHENITYYILHINIMSNYLDRLYVSRWWMHKYKEVLVFTNLRDILKRFEIFFDREYLKWLIFCIFLVKSNV